jgi:hypothetical protein
LINGELNNFIVRVGIGRWLKHLAITGVEALLISESFILVDVPETLWNFALENKIIKQIALLMANRLSRYNTIEDR